MSGIVCALRAGAALGCLYAGTVALGMGLMVLALQLGVLRSVDILFYRGLVVIALVFVALLIGLAIILRRLRIKGLSPRDAFAAAVLSFAMNVSFLVVVPVTVDRSISIFVLGQMAAQPQATFTSEEMTALFSRIYVGENRQIERRLHEQAVSGNVEKVGDGYRISARGRAVIEVAKVVEALFDSHAGLIADASRNSAKLGRQTTRLMTLP